MEHMITTQQILRELTDRRTDLYDVVYFYGDPDKTLGLIARLRTELTNRHPETTVRHRTGTAFASDVRERCFRGRLGDICRDYRGDLLILEGLDAVAGKETTEQALYGVLDWYLESGKRLVITGTAPLTAISALAERISAQISGGISLCVA